MAWLPPQFGAFAQSPTGAAPASYGSFAQPSAAPWADPSYWGSAIGRNSNLLLGLGAGLLSGNLGEVPTAIAQGAQADRSQNLQGYQLKLAQQQRDAAAKWASQMGHPEWAPAAEAGGLSIGDMFAATRPVPISGDGYLANPTTGAPMAFGGAPGGGSMPPGGNGAPGGGMGAGGAPVGNGIYRAPTPQERQQYGLKPDDPYMVNAATGKPIYVGNPTSVNINNKSEGSYASTRGADLAGNMKEIQNSGMQAYGTIGQLNLLQQALAGTYQGTAGQTVQKVKKMAQSLGINVDGVADGDLANSISNQLALQLRNPNGGAGMPGSLSDSDRQFLTSMAPNLGNTPQGNALMIEAAKRVQQRNIDIAKAASQYAKDHNNQLDDGFFVSLQQYSDAHPLFGDLIQAAGASQPPAAAPTVAPGAPPAAPGGFKIISVTP